MARLTRPERIGVWIWVIVAVVAWNGIYDVLLNRGAKDYLFRAALHDAGRGPSVPMALVMDLVVEEAIWVSTLWAGVILLAGLFTVRLLRCTSQLPTSPPSRPGDEPRFGEASPKLVDHGTGRQAAAGNSQLPK
jgi:hypothetical protein